MEDLGIAMKLMSKNCFMATIDLEDSYFLVPVHKDYRKYLRFSFRAKIFEFCALPFGLATAPYIFTKILRPVAAHLRERGFRSVIYLDDFLLYGESYNNCVENIKATLELLDKLGFVWNSRKCKLIPAQERKFLGFLLNSSTMSIILPEDKRLATLKSLEKYSRKRSCKIRNFASLIGSLNSICKAVPYGKIYLKDFEREKFLACVASNEDYDARMTICPSLLPDFRWWINKLLSPPVLKALQTQKFSLEIFSDASLTGWGASVGEVRTRGCWSYLEGKEHINFLELKAVHMAGICTQIFCERFTISEDSVTCR